MQDVSNNQGSVLDLGHANTHKKLHRLDGTEYSAYGGSF